MDAKAKQLLKKGLPRGYTTILANTTGYTRGYISNVLSGKVDSVKVELAAIQLWEEHKKYLDKIEEYERKQANRGND